MANSEVEVVNSALVKLEVAPISDLNQDRKAARTAKRQYPLRRQMLIRQYRWNFAVTRSDTLAPSGTLPKFGFENRFSLPPDCLRVIGLFDEQEPQQNYTTSRIPFKVEGRHIFKDGSEAIFFYLKDETDVTQWDASFAEVMAIDLAFDMGPTLKSMSAATKAQLKIDRRDAIKEARLSDAIEGSQEIVQASEWIDSRAFGHPRLFRPGPIV